MTKPSHSKIGASSAERWFACPGSVKLSEGIKGAESEYARTGTAAHHLAAFCLEYGYAAKRFLGHFVGQDVHTDEDSLIKPADVGKFKNCVEVTPDMVSAVQVYLDTVREIVGANVGHRDLEIEVKFHLDNIHPDLYGTSDAKIYDDETFDLWIPDYKHGEGVIVEAEGNPQLLYYGAGAAYSTSNLRVDNVHLGIVQPRGTGEPVKWWHVSAIDLLDFSATLAEKAAIVDKAIADYETMTPEEWQSAYLKPGDYCRWCKAAAICPALKATAEVASLDQYASGKAYDVDDLARSLNQMTALKGWLKALEEFAHSELHRGAVIPGWKLVGKRAVRGWLDEKEAERALLGDGRTEAEIYVPASLKSPAQIEEVLGKKDFAALVGDFVASVSSGTTIAPASDKRQAVNRNIADGFEPVSVEG